MTTSTIVQRLAPLVLLAVVLSDCASTRSPNVDNEAVSAERSLQLDPAFANLLKYQQQLDVLSRPIHRCYRFLRRRVNARPGRICRKSVRFRR